MFIVPSPKIRRRARFWRMKIVPIASKYVYQETTASIFLLGIQLLNSRQANLHEIDLVLVVYLKTPSRNRKKRAKHTSGCQKDEGR